MGITITGGLSFSGGLTVISPPTGGPYWIARLASLTEKYGYGVSTDSSDNVYVSGGNNFMGLYKYNNAGSLQWQRSLSGVTVNNTCSTIDSSNNIYLGGRVFNTSSSNYDVILAKYDSTGALQWQERTNNTAGGDMISSLSTDSSNNIYALGYLGTGGGTEVYLTKWNSSGTIQWQRRLASGSYSEGFSVTVDGTGNVYCVGQADTTPACGFLAKYDSSGTLQFQKFFSDSSNTVSLQGAVVDSSGNIYMSGWNYLTSGGGSAPYQVYVVKCNSTGTILWQRKLSSVMNSGGRVSIGQDNSGNVYIACDGITFSPTNRGWFFAKYNSSGALQWQRRMTSTSGFGQVYGINVSSIGTICATGYIPMSGVNDIFTMKLPGDGTLTGSYALGGATLSYAAISFDESAGSWTVANGSMTTGTPAYSQSTTTLSSAASSLTATQITL